MCCSNGSTGLLAHVPGRLATVSVHPPTQGQGLGAHHPALWQGEADPGQSQRLTVSVSKVALVKVDPVVGASVWDSGMYTSTAVPKFKSSWLYWLIPSSG